VLNASLTSTERPAGAERAASAVELAACREALLGWPLLSRKLPGLRQLYAHVLAGRMVRADRADRRPGFRPRLSPMLRPLAAGVAELRQQAIAVHASQWPDFAATAAQLQESIAAYTQRLGSAAQPCERQWLDDGVYGPSPRQFTNTAISET
jgi:hypothetical protein